MVKSNEIVEVLKLIRSMVILQLGPLYEAADDENTESTDSKVLDNIIDMVTKEALSVGNRMSETMQDILDMQSLIVQCSVIAFQNRGVEGQTRQNELGQDNHFIDWHQYLQSEVVKHGKRYVI